MVFTYGAEALGPTAHLVSSLGAALEGRDFAPVEVAQFLSKRFRLLGTQGLVGMAQAAIDMALWDGLARAQESSLARLLGGTEKPVQAYGGVGYDGPVKTANAAEAWVKQGLGGVKAKIGYPTVEEDVEVIRAMRSAVGEDIALMVDYNQSLTPVEAVVRAKRLDGEGLVWIEEPTLAQDFSGHARVSREIDTPIQCGENWWGPLEMRQAIESKASDYMMPDAMKIGGVTGWMKAAALGDAHRIPLSSHLWPELSAQLLAVTPTAHWLEYADWWNPVLAEPLKVTDGFAHFEGVVGSGVEWNEEAVARCAA